MTQPAIYPARRTVYNAEAVAWLGANAAEPDTSVVTSLPDTSEVAALSFDEWRTWFVDTARRVIRWVPAGGVSIFFQSDIRHEGAWIDKSHLILTAAEAEGALLVWHKIVCRRAPGTISAGRPTFSHMLCLTRAERAVPNRPGPDVIPDAGFMPWPRAMGETACRVACRFLRHETETRLVVDPFCGEGSVLAVANSLGFDAVGVDLSRRRCRLARRQTLVPKNQQHLV